MVLNCIRHLIIFLLDSCTRTHTHTHTHLTRNFKIKQNHSTSLLNSIFPYAPKHAGAMWVLAGPGLWIEISLPWPFTERIGALWERQTSK